MTAKEIFERLRASSNPIYIWGGGIVSVRIYERLLAEGIKVKGRFVDIPFEGCNIIPLEGEMLELHEVLAKEKEIDVVIGHGHIEKSDSLKAYSQIRNVYVFLNPYAYYQGVGVDFLNSHKEQFALAEQALSDDTSKRVLKAYFVANDTNDYWVLNQDNFIIQDVFSYENMSLGSDEIFVDAGAYTGDTLRLYLEKTGGKYKSIHAFEPNPYSFAQLKKNVEKYENIYCYQIGVGEKNDTFQMRREDCESSCLIPKELEGKNEILVDVKPLDSVFEDGEKPTLIKIFVPYMDYEIIKGAKKIISENKPKLIVGVGLSDGSRIFDIINYIHYLNPEYKMSLRFNMPTQVRLFLYCY